MQLLRYTLSNLAAQDFKTTLCGISRHPWPGLDLRPFTEAHCKSAYSIQHYAVSISMHRICLSGVLIWLSLRLLGSKQLPSGASLPQKQMPTLLCAA